MVQCKTILLIFGIILLLFFGIPIRVPPPPSANNDTISQFENYIDKFNKNYRDNETLRLQKLHAFQSTLEEIDELNSKRRHNISAIFGLTKYSDMTKEEFKQKYLLSDMYTRLNNSYIHTNEHSGEKDSIEVHLVRRSTNIKDLIPLKVDWRKEKVITKIQNQKSCGACWAFSAVETIESMVAIKTGRLESLSVQQLIDCAGYNNAGCNGGDICSLLNWMVDNKIKVRKEVEYPLHWKTETCKLNKSSPGGVEVADFECNSLINEEDAILYLIANHGPVAVGINAMLWQNYLGGVIHYHCDGSLGMLNHAVQIVGYDKTGDIPFYIVRNSWGSDFGDKGFLYIAIGSNMCGLANEVVSLDVL